MKKVPLSKRVVYLNVEARCICCGGLVDMTLGVQSPAEQEGDAIRDVECFREEPITRRYLKGSEKPCACRKKGKK